MSDGEEAERAALEAVWPGKPNQMCHVHFLGDIALTIHTGDRQLRAKMGESFGKLPPVSGNKVTAKTGPRASTVELNGATIAETEKRWLYRLHRWPTKTAMNMVTEYLALRHQRHSAQPAGP